MKNRRVWILLLTLIFIIITCNSVSAANGGKIISAEVKPTYVISGQSVTYETTVQNTGTTTLPYQLEFSGSFTTGKKETQFTLNPGEVKTVTYTTHSKAGAPGTITFTHALYIDWTWPTDNELLDTVVDNRRCFSSEEVSDVDNDNLLYFVEVEELGTNPNNPDTDGDNKPDDVDNRPTVAEGTFHFTSNPSDVTVYLDGSNVGKTPFSLDNTISKQYVIEMRKNGYRTKTLNVNLNPGAIENVYNTLDALVGSIAFSSNPSGAKVYLNDAYKGIAPLTLTQIPVGSYTVKFMMDGYNDKIETITVTDGGTATVSGTLITKTGSIIASSVPSGAKVYLDGKYKGTTPLTIDRVTPGTHDVKLTQSGYDDETTSILVKADTYEKVSKTLKLVPIAATPSAKVDPAPPSTKVESTTSGDAKSKTQDTPTTASTLPFSGILSDNKILYGGIGIILILSLLVGAVVSKSRKSPKTKDKITSTHSSNSTGLKQSNNNDLSDKHAAILKNVQEKPVTNQSMNKSDAAPVITSAFGYKGATIQYKIKVQNPTSDPIADIKVNLYLPDVFLVSEATKTITMLKPSESKTVTFEIRPTGECGDCEVSGKVVYYDYSTKKTTGIDIHPKSLSIVCPMLKMKEISESEWHNIVGNLIETEESTKDIDMPAETLFEMISRIVKDMHMHRLEPEITQNQRIFNAVARFYGEGVKGLKYAAQVEVVGGANKAKLILKTWAEKEEALTGFYHGLLDEIEKRVQVKEYINDNIVQNVYHHHGDNIGTQVKDSVVQRSNIGTDTTEKKCSTCGTVAEGNGDFCNGCGGKL